MLRASPGKLANFWIFSSPWLSRGRHGRPAKDQNKLQSAEGLPRAKYAFKVHCGRRATWLTWSHAGILNSACIGKIISILVCILMIVLLACLQATVLQICDFLRLVTLISKMLRDPAWMPTGASTATGRKGGQCRADTMFVQWRKLTDKPCGFGPCSKRWQWDMLSTRATWCDKWHSLNLTSLPFQVLCMLLPSYSLVVPSLMESQLAKAFNVRLCKPYQRPVQQEEEDRSSPWSPKWEHMSHAMPIHADPCRVLRTLSRFLSISLRFSPGFCIFLQLAVQRRNSLLWSQKKRS